MNPCVCVHEILRASPPTTGENRKPTDGDVCVLTDTLLTTVRVSSSSIVWSQSSTKPSGFGTTLVPDSWWSQ